MSSVHRKSWRDRCPDAFPPRGLALWRRAVAILLGLGLFLWGLHALEVTPGRLIDGIGQLGKVFMLMMPPAVTEHVWEYIGAIGETLAMAFLGTLVASVIAIPLAMMGARNIMPLGPVRFLVRRSSDVVRGIDSLVWAIFFVSVVGLGPFAGILAIAVNDIGVLPQVMPVFLGNSLYFLESNLRSATILGVVGAGGIGFFLMDRMMINAWREVALIVIMVLITVACIDALSRMLRARLIGSSRG